MERFKIKKNDEVIIITGKDKGKKGKIIKVFSQNRKVLVAGVNLVKKHTKPSQESAGGIISKESPIDISNVAYFDTELGKPTKLGYKFLADGTKVRVSKKSGKVIDKEGK